MIFIESSNQSNEWNHRIIVSLNGIEWNRMELNHINEE